MINRKKFSLIELLIVVGILGALSCLLLPSFIGAEDEAKLNTANSEMKSIQKSFQRFVSDVNFRCDNSSAINPTNKKLLDITQYGLWPLLIDKHPVLGSTSPDYISYKDYNIDTGFGRRVPYMEYNGLVNIDETLDGQELSDNATSVQIPVIKDPYGGYYRILYPKARTVANGGNNYNEYKRLQRMVLVCTGKNKTLDTKIDSFLPTADSHKSNADELVAQGDDIIIRLMPFSGL